MTNKLKTNQEWVFGDGRGEEHHDCYLGGACDSNGNEALICMVLQRIKIIPDDLSTHAVHDIQLLVNFLLTGYLSGLTGKELDRLLGRNELGEVVEDKENKDCFFDRELNNVSEIVGEVSSRILYWHNNRDIISEYHYKPVKE